MMGQFRLLVSSLPQLRRPNLTEGMKFDSAFASD